MFFYSQSHQPKPVDTTKVLQEDQTRTKELLKLIFPEVPDSSESLHKWIEHLGDYVKNHDKQNATTNCNKSNSDDTSHNQNNVQSDLLKDANFLLTVHSYKKMMTDHELLLKNVEKKSVEREQYWQEIVDQKNEEIDRLKTNAIEVSIITVIFDYSN